MKIMFAAAEGAPFAKTGGLGDVIGALPKALAKKGNEVIVVLPYYDLVDAGFGDQVSYEGYYYTDVGWRHQYVGIRKLIRDGVTFYFLTISSISSAEGSMERGMTASALPSSSWRPLSSWSGSISFRMCFMSTTITRP